MSGKSSVVLSFIVVLSMVGGSVLLVGVGSQPARAATFVVNDDGTPSTGLCGSAGYTTIQGAVNDAAVNAQEDTIIVCNGTYDETVVVNTPVAIVGNASAVVDNTVDTSDGTDGTAFTITSGSVAIDGLEIRGYTQSGGTGGHGIAVDPSASYSDFVFQNLDIHDVEGDGISVAADAGNQHDTVRINNSTVTAVGGTGINLVNVRDVLVESNTVTGGTPSVGGTATTAAVRVHAVGSSTAAGATENVSVELVSVGGTYSGTAPLVNVTAVGGGTGETLLETVIVQSLDVSSVTGGGSGVALGAVTPGAGTSNLSTVVLNDSTIDPANGDGVAVSADGSGTVYEVVVRDNEVTDPADRALVANATDSATVDGFLVNNLTAVGGGVTSVANDSARIERVLFNLTNVSGATRGFVVGATDTGTVVNESITLSSVDGASEAVVVLSGDSAGDDANVTDLELAGNALNNTAGATGIAVRTRGTSELNDPLVRLNALDGNQRGLTATLREDSTVSGLNVTNNTFQGNSRAGINVTLAAPGATSESPILDDATVDIAFVNGTGDGVGLGVHAYGNGTVRNVVADTVNASNNSVGVELEATDTATVDNVSFNLTDGRFNDRGFVVDAVDDATVSRLNVTNSTFEANAVAGINVTLGTPGTSESATLENSELRRVFVNGTGNGVGLGVHAFGNASVRDLFTNALNASNNSVGIALDATDTATVDDATFNRTDGRFNDRGVLVDIDDDAVVSRLNVTNSTFEQNDREAINVTLEAQPGERATLADAEFRNAIINGTGDGVGLRINAFGNATVRNLFTNNLNASNNSVGVALNATGTATVDDVRFNRTEARLGERGFVSDVTGSATVSALRLTNNSFAENNRTGVDVSFGVPGSTDDVTVTDAAFRTNLVNETSGTGARIAVNGNATVRDLAAEEFVGSNTTVGVEITASNTANLTDVSVERTLANDSTTGLRLAVSDTAALSDAVFNTTVGGDNVIDVTAADGTRLTNVSFNNTLAADGATGVRFAARNTTEITDLAINRTLADNGSTAVRFTASESANLTDAILNGTLANNDSIGLQLDAVESANLSDVTVNATLASNNSTGAAVTAADGTRLVNITFSNTLVDNESVGTSFAARNTTDISSLAINRTLVSNSSTGATVIATQSANLTDAILNGTLASNNSTGAVVTAADGTRLANVSFNNTLVDNGSTGVRFGARNTTEVTDLAINRTLAGNDSTGAVVTVSGSANLTRLVFNGTLAEDNSTGVLVTTTDTATVENVSFNATLADNATAGVRLTAMDGSNVTNVTFNNTLASNSTIGIEVNSTGGTVTDLTVQRTAGDDNDLAVGVVASGDGTIRRTKVRRNLLSGNAEGLLTRATGQSTVRNLRVTQNLLDNSSQAALTIEEAGSGDHENVNVFLNFLNDSSTALRVGSGTSPEGIRFALNFMYGDTVGVNNLNGSSNFTARQNFWGDDSGPSSIATASQTPLVDPVSGEPADGSGAAVSEGNVAGVSNVIFDPWLGKPTCQDPQLINVTSQILPTIRGVSLDQVLPVCVWERSWLPLRDDPDTAATHVGGPDVFTEGAPVLEGVAVYQQNRSFDITFESKDPVADTSRFANDDVQLLVLRAGANANVSSLDPSFSFNNSTGRVTLTSNLEIEEVVDDAGGVTSLDGDGRIRFSYTPGTDDQYAFVLFRKKFGAGITNVSNGSVTVDGGIDLVGIETTSVQETNSSAAPTRGNRTYVAGENVTFQVDSNLAAGTTNHTVLLYDKSRIDDDWIVNLDATADVENLLAGSTNGSNVTADTNVVGFRGVLRNERTVTVFNITFNETNTSGDAVLNGSVTFRNATLRPASGPTYVVNASATALAKGTKTDSVTVGTLRVADGGTYKFVHVAERGGNLATTSGTLTIVEPQPPVSDPGGPYRVRENSNVQLDGTGSFDPDGGSLSYNWTIVNDPTGNATLSGNTTAQPTFNAPEVSSNQAVTVALNVTDNEGNSSVNTTTVRVRNRRRARQPGPGPAPTPTPGQADIEFVSADVTPAEAAVDEPVTVTATVENTGDATGTIEVRLFVDGSYAGESRIIEVPAGERRTVTFETAFEAPGEYDVTLQNAEGDKSIFAGRVTVTAPTTAPPTTAPPTTAPPTTAPPTAPPTSPSPEGPGPFGGLLVPIILALLVVLGIGVAAYFLLFSPGGPGGGGGGGS